MSIDTTPELSRVSDLSGASPSSSLEKSSDVSSISCVLVSMSRIRVSARMEALACARISGLTSNSAFDIIQE